MGTAQINIDMAVILYNFDCLNFAFFVNKIVSNTILT